MGKYATRGMKGAKSRAGGGVKPTFEGGQTPLHRRTPKLGYMPAMLDTPFEPVNLEKLQLWIDSGRIDASRKVTMRVMLESGLVSSIKHGVKLLARGTREGRFAAPGLDIEVSQASAAAIEAVEAAGGCVKSIYLTPLALRAHLQPAAKFDVPIQAPLPPPKLMKLYTSYEHRGYLSPEMQLREIKQRLASGVPHEKAVQVLPVYVGESAAAMALAESWQGRRHCALPIGMRAGECGRRTCSDRLSRPPSLPPASPPSALPCCRRADRHCGEGRAGAGQQRRRRWTMMRPVQHARQPGLQS